MKWKTRAPVIFKRAHKVLDFQKKYFENLTKSQIDLMDYYTGGESLWLNNYLRGVNMHKIDDDQRLILKKKSKTLNKLIRQAPTSPKPMVLFRAIETGVPNKKPNLYKRGDHAEFLSRGLVSTSTSYEAAFDFLEKGETCCMLVLLVPKGTKMLLILERSEFDYEQEVLLAHGQKFQILKTIKLNGITTYYCVLVGQKNNR